MKQIDAAGLKEKVHEMRPRMAPLSFLLQLIWMG